MSNTEANSSTSTPAPVGLSTMLGTLGGEAFKIGDKTYIVKPMGLKHVDEFMKDELSIGPQLYNVIDDDVKKKIDKWISGYCFGSNGEAMSLQKAMDDDWNLVDLREFLRKLCDLSGS